MTIDEARLAERRHTLLLLDESIDRFAGDHMVYIRALSGDGEIATVVRPSPTRLGTIAAIELVNVRRLTSPTHVRVGADFGEE